MSQVCKPIRRFTNGEFPWELEYPRGDVDDMVPSSPCVIDDAVSRGKFYLRVGGGTYAYKAVGADLKDMVKTKHYRAPKAVELLLRIERQMLAEAFLSKEFVMLPELMSA